MTTKHTPKPWKVVKHSMETNYITIQAENKVGRLLPIANMTIHHGKSKLANAVLMSAAPELLAACKELLECVGYFAEDVFPDDAIFAASSKARNAIVKATKV